MLATKTLRSQTAPSRRAWLCFATALGAALPLCAFGAQINVPETLTGAVQEKFDPKPIAWLDPAGLLPPRADRGNAAELYAKAAEAIRKVAGFPTMPRTLEPYLEWPDLREALRRAVDGSALKNADFLALYSYRSWEQGAMPDLAGAVAVNRALSMCARLFLDAREFEKACHTAQAAVGMGEHYFSGAPNLVQALVGQTMMEEGMIALRVCYLRSGNPEKAREAAKRLSGSQGVREAVGLKNAAAVIDRWGDVSIGLLACSDPDPVIRADTLLLIEACFHPEGLKRMQSNQQTSVVATRIRAEPKACQEAVASLVRDPNPIVRRLAERVSGVLSSRR